MALAVPSTRNIARELSYSGRATDTWGTQITASATPHALTGTPTQIIAATRDEAEWIRVSVFGMHTTATNTDALLNIYIGAGGSEVLFIDSLMAGWTDAQLTLALTGHPRTFWFPVRIPRGTRISAELRALIASDTCRVLIDLGVSNGTHWVGSGVETLGEDTAASEGTDITPGTTSEGTFTSIGTTGRRYRYITPGIMGNNDTTLLQGDIAWDIGTSSAVLQGMEHWLTNDHSSEVQSNWYETGWWCDIPSGTALELRGQSGTTVSGLQTACLYGVY